MLINALTTILINLFFKNEAYKFIDYENNFDKNNIKNYSVSFVAICMILYPFMVLEEFIEYSFKKLLWFLKSVWDFVWIFLYVIYNMNIFNISIINKIRLYVVVFMKLRYNINLHNSFSEREITGDIMFNALE